MALNTDALFGRRWVRKLDSTDFLVESITPIYLRWNDCIVILFYGNNVESINLSRIWAFAAQKVVGPIFAAVDLFGQPKIAEAFVRAGQDPGPLRTFRLQGYPFIIAYQKGAPVGFYNGERDVQAIIDWSLTLACNPNYFEVVQLAASAHIAQSYEMGGINQYTPIRTDSLQYVAGQPIRTYDSQTGVVETGSSAASKEARAEQAERQVAGVPITGSPETGETAAGVTPEAPVATITPGQIVPSVPAVTQ